MVKYNSLKLKKISMALVFVTFFKFIFCEEKKISQLKFPVTLTLYNNNILLITNEEIILYDSNLENKLNNYTLEESIRPTKVDESIKSMAYQYKEIYGFYILAFVHDHLFIFDNEGNNKCEIDLTEYFGNITLYDVTPIKKLDNNLTYVITFTNNNPYQIVIYYFSVNIETCENNFILEKYNITPFPDIKDMKLNSISENVSCQLMNSLSKNNILVCFFGITYPSFLNVASFDIEDNLNYLSSYSTFISSPKSYNIELIKSKNIDNESTSLLCFFQKNQSPYTCLYDINENNFTTPIKRGEIVGSSLRCLNFIYFYQTQQFLLSFKDNNLNLKIIILNKNYQLVEDFDYTFEKYYDIHRHSFIYSEKDNYYSIISDSAYSGEVFIRLFENITIVHTSNIINDKNSNGAKELYISYSGFFNELNKSENPLQFDNFTQIGKYTQSEQSSESEYYKTDNNLQTTTIIESDEITFQNNQIISDKNAGTTTKIESDEITFQNNQFLSDKNEGTTTIKEYFETSYINNKIESDKIEVDDKEMIKCSSFNLESLKLNLCTKCNTALGYYPVNFFYNIYPENIIECYNNDTKQTNFYFNKKKQQYEPCFETCNTCEYGGNEEINNCTSCDINGIFRPEINGTTNCVKNCKYKYYYTPYGQYKCTLNEQCPEEANLLIKPKNKCISSCILDDKYNFQYNAECLDECPNGTKEKDNICYIIDTNKCSYKRNEDNLDGYLTTDEINLLAKKYAKEYIYTNSHITIYKYNLYSISIYKNKECINELSLSIPQIDFGSCNEKIRKKNNIETDLIILIIEKYFNGTSLLLYSFYHPITGEKINVLDECKNEDIIVKEDILSVLETTDLDIENILKLTQQNINIFNKSSGFYNDICFHYDSPNEKDITLKDRIKEFFPNITLCNEGCICNGINLTSMQAICQCTINDLFNENIISGNAFVSNIINEVTDILYESNFMILKCYKDIFVYKYFIKNIGGFIILFIIFSQIICVFIYQKYSLNEINKYIFILLKVYFSYMNKKAISTNKNRILTFINNMNPPYRKKKKKSPKIVYQNNMNVIKFNINNYNSRKKDLIDSFKLNNSKNILFVNNHNKKGNKNKIVNLKTSNKHIIKTTKKRGKVNFKDQKDNLIVNKFINAYLSTDYDELDYDYAIKMDKRRFFPFLWERVKNGIIYINILFVYEPIKPITIKLLLILINTDLYFLIDCLFINEDYISEKYHSTEEFSFFDYTKRIYNNIGYTTIVIIVIEIIINCFFFEEKKLKRLFIREKNNKLNIKFQSMIILQEIKSRYFSFFITSFIITIISWYYITCFNNVYPNMVKEWIKSSITIIIIMNIFLNIIISLLESILRFLSFKCNSEKLFKISQIFS